MLSALSLLAVALMAGPSSVDWARLIDASAKAITAPRGSIRGEDLGRFNTAIGQARAFKTNFVQGQFHRHYVILIERANTTDGPVTVMLTNNAKVDALALSKGATPPVFVDVYTCNSHSTLSMLPTEPTFEELRVLVTEKLQAPPAAANPASSCAFGPYLLPGLRAPR